MTKEAPNQRIEVRKEGSRATLVLGGRLTRGEGADLLRETIDQLLQEGYREFVLDLECVPYLDSQGLGDIVRLYTTIGRQGGTVRLLHLTKRITELLSTAKRPSWLPSSFEPWFRPRDWNTAMWCAFSILLLIVIMIVWTLGTAPRLMPGR